MHVADRRLQDLLQQARKALEQGHAKRAVIELWRAASVALYDRDEAGLEAIVLLTSAAQDGASARVRHEAVQLSAYCQNCLADLRTGRLRRRALADLFSLDRDRR